MHIKNFYGMELLWKMCLAFLHTIDFSTYYKSIQACFFWSVQLDLHSNTVCAFGIHKELVLLILRVNKIALF